MFCFDNTFSSVSEKIIFFELILDNMDTDKDPDDWKEYVQGTDTLDMRLEDIMVRLQTDIEKMTGIAFPGLGLNKFACVLTFQAKVVISDFFTKNILAQAPLLLSCLPLRHLSRFHLC